MSFIFNENTGQVDRWSMLIVKWFSQQLYMSLLPSTGQPHNENKTQNGVNASIKKRTKCLFYYYIYTQKWSFFKQSKTIRIIVIMIDCGSVVMDLFRICIVAHIGICVLTDEYLPNIHSFSSKLPILHCEWPSVHGQSPLIRLKLLCSSGTNKTTSIFCLIMVGKKSCQSFCWGNWFMYKCNEKHRTTSIQIIYTTRWITVALDVSRCILMCRYTGSLACLRCRMFPHQPCR